jgi:hypothetical protein
MHLADLLQQEGDLAQADATGVIGPRLEQFLRVTLHAMALRVRVVIGWERDGRGGVLEGWSHGFVRHSFIPSGAGAA